MISDATAADSSLAKPTWLSWWTVNRLAQRGDVLVVTVVVAVIVLMVLPVPLALLDLLIAVNISASVALLMLAIYVPSAAGLSTFPSLLLFTTILRLSLNIASLKQILLHAHAGHIIETFGRLVVGGNPLVGGVVFVVIAVVQFIVIAKGAERVAEVGARFTLDGMPGKQMSIDADVRAGTIGPEEARRRRAALETESQWHGAMDGAMKFVKGDAIAALIIAFINIIAGIGVGASKGMSVGEAVGRYTLLTVGEGMVSQIPSLFVSLAAGLLITRVSSTLDKRTNLGTQLMSQLLSQPMSLAMTAAVVIAFVAVPGFPKLQFALLGLTIGAVAHLAFRGERKAPAPTDRAMPAMRGDAEKEIPNFIDDAGGRASVPLLIKVAPGLRQHLIADAFSIALTAGRQRLYQQLGLPFPGIRLHVDANLPDGQYRIFAQDILKGKGELFVGCRRLENGHPQATALAAVSKGAATAYAQRTDGFWVPIEPKSLLATDTAVLTPEQVLAEHACFVIAAHADLFLGIQEVQKVIEETGKLMPDLAQEVVRAVPLQRIADVMRRLLQENLPIRNTREIFESLIVWAPREKDVVLLTEYVRIDLGAMTVSRVADGRPELPLIALVPDAEEVVRAAIQTTIGGSFLALGLDRIDSLTSQIRTLLDQAAESELKPVMACSMDVRRYIRKAIEPTFPELTVLSYQELGSHIRVTSVGQVTL
jgi:type III secretion protein V